MLGIELAHPSTRRGFTPAQREVIEHIKANAPYAGTAKSITRELNASLTLKQVEGAMNGLESASCLLKTWNPDRYVWNLTLNGEAAK